MIIHDISMTIEEQMQVYKNKAEKRPSLQVTRDFSDSAARESRLCLDMHTGTHLDMPMHFVPNGGTVEQLDLHRVVTQCRVFDLSHIEKSIHASDLTELDIRQGDTVLFKTRNSMTDIFDPEFVYLAGDGAVYLQERGIQCVGIDGLGIERSQPDYLTHRTLLGSDILVIEGLRLKDIRPGSYLLVAAPLKIASAEAAPLRALLLENI
jgi:arylformamidase